MNKKSAYIALIGKPNAGKSTLLNCLVQEKISIVTPKVQTTRKVIKGIVTQDNTQLIFIDAPGIFIPQGKLEKLIVNNAIEALNEADILCILFDSSKENFLQGNEMIFQKIKSIKKPVIAILNKVDLIKDKTILLEKATQLDDLKLFQKIFMISALKISGINDLVSYLSESAPHSHWFFEDDIITDKSEREIVEEITREQVYLNLNKELPYSLKVETDKWEENEEMVRINQSIITNKASHKAILIGRKGSKLKTIGTGARLNIQRFLNKKVHLSLFIKVREDWIDKTRKI